MTRVRNTQERHKPSPHLLIQLYCEKATELLGSRADSQNSFQISYPVMSLLEGFPVLKTYFFLFFFFFISLPLLEKYEGRLQSVCCYLRNQSESERTLQFFRANQSKAVWQLLVNEEPPQNLLQGGHSFKHNSETIPELVVTFIFLKSTMFLCLNFHLRENSASNRWPSRRSLVLNFGF